MPNNNLSVLCEYSDDTFSVEIISESIFGVDIRRFRSISNG